MLRWRLLRLAPDSDEVEHAGDEQCGSERNVQGREVEDTAEHLRGDQRQKADHVPDVLR